MKILSAEDVKNLLSLEEAINLIKKQMVSVSMRECILPLRNVVDLGQSKKFGIMPGSLGKGMAFGVKLLSLFPENPSKALSSHIGLITLFDPDTGIPKGVVNADMITAIRTAAASAVATEQLAKDTSKTMAIIGTGEQAEYHVKSIPLIRPIKKINLVGSSVEKAEIFVDKVSKSSHNLKFEIFEKVKDAVKASDIICTVTSSKDPVLFGDWVKSGTHINAVGASIPLFQEIDISVITKARLFVDYIPSALAQAKEILYGIENKIFNESFILGEIGEVLAGNKTGRRGQEDITVYRSLGIAAQDLVCAQYVLEKSNELKTGTSVKIL